MPRDVAERLVAKVDNIPYYIQQLGFEVFRLVEDEGRKKATKDDLDSACRLLSGFNRDQYEQQMLNFSVAQKKLPIALAHELMSGRCVSGRTCNTSRFESGKGGMRVKCREVDIAPRIEYFARG